jgi:hypothetical protein
MATAAVLVLVIGVAGTLYVRGIDPQYAASPPSKAVAPSAAQEMAAPGAAAQPPAGMAGPATETVTAGDHAAAGSATGASGDAVDVDDLAKGQASIRPEQLAKQDADAPAKLKVARTGRAEEPPSPLERRAEPARKAAVAPSRDLPAPAPSATKPAPPARADQGDPRERSDKKSAGIVLRTPELALKENDDEAQAPRRQTDNADGTRPRLRGAGPVPGGAAGGAPTTTPPAATAEPAPPPPSVASAANVNRPPASPAAAPRPTPATGDSLNDARDRFADKPTSKDARAGEKASEKASEKTIEQKPAQNKAVLDWARKQHGQVITLVGANNCRAAASAAIAIYSRAPDYYASNVVTDRSIKPCLPYLNTERAREDRSRAAAKNAASDAPAEAPTRK